MDFEELEAMTGGWLPWHPLDPFPLTLGPVVPARIRRGRQAALRELGRASLRMRLFRGWSQREVELRSGVDQSTISRFERGRQEGMSIQRLAALLQALNVERIDFLPPPCPAPTNLELMLHGDRWEQADQAANRWLARPPRRRR